MKFDDLPVGAQFKFYARGPIRTKTSPSGFAAGGDELPASFEAFVIPVDLEPPSLPPEPVPRSSKVLIRYRNTAPHPAQVTKLAEETVSRKTGQKLRPKADDQQDDPPE